MFSLTLNEHSDVPLYLQLYEHLKKYILEKTPSTDGKLPSKRVMASNLGISVNTVTSAYEALIDEGYIYSKERSGYFLSDIENFVNLQHETSFAITPDEIKHYRYDFKISNIDTERFPAYTLKRMVSEVMEHSDRKWLMDNDPQGMAELRNAISRYIYNYRDVDVSPDNIVISSGTEYLMQMFFYIMPEKSIFGLENPGYTSFRELFSRNNIECSYLKVNENGVQIDDITSANILLITPSHQFPTGNVMPVGERIKLLDWANSCDNRYIIEDDYDSEFKYYGKPIPSLKSMDMGNSVIYVGNFSRSIAPGIRLSYMVLPDRLLEKYYDVKPFNHCPVSGIMQSAIANLIEKGYFERHINRMRSLYRKKRNLATKLFEKHKEFTLLDNQAGLHFIVEIDTSVSEKEIIDKLREHDIYVEGFSSYYVDGTVDYDKPRLIIGFGGQDEATLKEGIELLIDIITTQIT